MSYNIVIRQYPNKRAGDHINGSHYTVKCEDTLDEKLQAKVIADHLKYGHPKILYRHIYSHEADNPWVGTYSRGNDGELRPFLKDTVSDLSEGLNSGSLFMQMISDFLEQLGNQSDKNFINDSNNYIVHTFENVIKPVMTILL